MRMKFNAIGTALLILCAVFVWVGLEKQQTATATWQREHPYVDELYERAKIPQADRPHAPTPALAVYAYILAATTGLAGVGFFIGGNRK